MRVNMSREATAAGALQHARELEKLRYQERFKQRVSERRSALARLVADMTARGFLQSGQRYEGELNIATKFMADTIDDQISFRREMIGAAPELGSDLELLTLLESVNERITAFSQAAAPRHPLGEIVLPQLVPALARQRGQAAADLRSQARIKIDILRREVALDMVKGSHQSVTTDGPAIINLGTIYGNVQQVIGNVGSSDQELAGLLKRLAEAISDAADLGEQRAAYLEQVKFVAEQAAVPKQERQPSSIVQAVFIQLRARLQDAAHISHILVLLGPSMAKHFGLPWPF